MHVYSENLVRNMSITALRILFYETTPAALALNWKENLKKISPRVKKLLNSNWAHSTINSKK